MRSGKAGKKKTSNDLGFTTLRLFCEHCKLAKNTQYWEAKELVLFFERKKNPGLSYDCLYWKVISFVWTSKLFRIFLEYCFSIIPQQSMHICSCWTVHGLVSRWTYAYSFRQFSWGNDCESDLSELEKYLLSFQLEVSSWTELLATFTN